MGSKAKYEKEIKLEIVKRYLKGESPLGLANKYNISTSEIVSQLVLKYNSGIEIKDYN